MTIKRRDFLSHIAAGSSILTLPTFLVGCGINQAVNQSEALPDDPFGDWFGIDEAVVSQVMAELTANGADAADLYFQHSRSNALRLEDAIVTRNTSAVLQGVGLRVVSGDQTGYAFTEDLTLSSMLAAARIASAAASGNMAMPPQAFNPMKSGDLYALTVPWTEVGLNEKLAVLESADRIARSADQSVGAVTVNWTDVDDRILIATLQGDVVRDRRPMTRLSVQVTAKRDGDSQSGFSSIAARDGLSWYSRERIESVVGEAVDRTLILFESRRSPAGELPVVLASGTSGVLLHEAIGHGMEADFNRNGTSQYANLMGSSIADGQVTIADQGTMPNERGALNYDDEGTTCGRTVLVENGVLRSYLHDSVSAGQYKTRSTGSGRRESYQFAPMPRMTCTFMENGPHTRDEVIAAVDHGVLAETYTDASVRIGEGDYNFYVKNGWLIEKGKVTAPLRDFSISGNGVETLKRITMVADDGRMDAGGWTCGKNGQSVPVSQGMPTVLVSGINVTG